MKTIIDLKEVLKLKKQATRNKIKKMKALLSAA